MLPASAPTWVSRGGLEQSQAREVGGIRGGAQPCLLGMHGRYRKGLGTSSLAWSFSEGATAIAHPSLPPPPGPPGEMGTGKKLQGLKSSGKYPIVSHSQSPYAEGEGVAREAESRMKRTPTKGGKSTKMTA